MSRKIKESKQLETERIERFKFLIKEYEQVKQGAHKGYQKVGEFYKAQGIDRRYFNKYYRRYQQGQEAQTLLPQKRGPRYKTRRLSIELEKQVILLREQGNNKYEIAQQLKTSWQDKAPSATCIYNVFKRHGVNRLTPTMKQTKQRIIRERAGELAHVDAHYIGQNVIGTNKHRWYLVSVMDDCTRITGSQLVSELKSLTVMFAVLRLLHWLDHCYDIQFKELLSDNGAEFGARHYQNKNEHPFERMLFELGIRHRDTQPYRPQTNGKIERFWRTLNEDMLAGVTYKDSAHFEQELMEYHYYYNHQRPHQGLGARTPVQQLARVEKVKSVRS